MPVPSFLTRRSARHRSALVERLPLDQSAEDERRRTMTVMPGVNGVDPWDRPNWPLPLEQSAAEETDAALREELAKESATLRGYQNYGNTVVGRHTYSDHEVSDVEEEDEEEHEAKDDVETIATSSSHTLPRNLPSNRRSAESHRVDFESVQVPQPGVSPHTNRHQGSPPSSFIHPGSNSGASRVATSVVSESLESTINTTPADTSLPITSSSLQPHQAPVQLQVNGRDRAAEDDEVQLDKRHTLPTIPKTSPRESHSLPALQQASRLSYYPAPGSNIAVSTISRSSATKTPMISPNHRRHSTRSSLNTTAISPQKECLRYSWQSLHDVEPNRPRIHIIKLVSNTVTAAAGFPTSEAFGFSISPRGRRIAAFNSSRLFVLQTAALPVGITQEYALKRRPLAVEVTDVGNTMAILADDHTINIYEIGLNSKRIRTIKLDFPTTCIALATTGGLIAAAFEGSIEIFSLDPKALPTDRRAVRSGKMDKLAFSEDGSTLLGTTVRAHASSTVVVSVPVFPAAASNIPTHEELKVAWCSELLHPENIRNSSHAVFMRENRQTTSEKLFAWNGLEDAFGLLNMTDLTYGDIEFPLFINPLLSTSGGLGAAIHSCPTIDEFGDTIAVIVNDRTIRLYIVPPKEQDGEEAPVEARSIDHQLDEGYGCPFSEARWMHSSPSLPAPADNLVPVQGRLIVTSPGGVSESLDESVEDVEGGRIILFDFDPQFSGQPGQTFSLILGKRPPQMLEEEQVDVAEQVALVRKRTVTQSHRGGLNQRSSMLGRSASTVSRPHRGFNPSFGQGRNRSSMISIGTMQSEGARSLPDLMESNEQADVFEEPYVPGQPRSHASLQRAASNAQRHRYQTLEERNRENISTDNSSGNFLSLPEYSEEPNAPLPQKFRTLAGLDGPQMFDPNKAKARDGDEFDFEDRSRPDDTPIDSAISGGNGERSNWQTPILSPTGGLPSPFPHSTPPTSVRAFTPTLRGGELYRSASPAASMRTFDSVSQPGTMPSHGPLASLPRSLQRAYGNAVALPGGPPPPHSETDEPWDAISPVSRWGNHSPLPISPVHGGNNGMGGGSHRLSQYSHTSVSNLSPAVHAAPSRTVSSAGSHHTGSYSNDDIGGFSPALSSRRLPPHMQAFRNAAAAAAAAQTHNAPPRAGSPSLFPPSPARDLIPLRTVTSGGKAGTVPHPITAWHPPAASSPTQRDSGKVMEPVGGLARTASERSTASGKMTGSTGGVAGKGLGKGKKSAFFHRGRKGDVKIIGEPENFAEKRSAFSRGSSGGQVKEGKCVVM